MSLNIIAWHDRTAADHDNLTNANAAKGYRFLSLSIYGEPNDPRFAAVMILRQTIVAQQSFHRQKAAEFQQTFNDMSKKGFGPIIVSATGSGSDPLIASVFQMMQPTPLTRFGITETEMQTLNIQAYSNGQILQWADAYGTANDTRYIAVWHPNPLKVEWNCGSADDSVQNATNDNAIDAQRRFDAIAAAGCRPKHIAHTPKPGVLEVYTDDTIGPWASRVNLTSQQYQDTFNEFMAKGLAPIRVSAHGTGNNARFAAIFASREDGEPKTFRMKGTNGMASVNAIDQAMENFVIDHRLHGASLAIINNTRLVYAKGYTWAGSSYPDIQPTTLFRQASCSKTVAAIALYRWMQLHPATTLNTTMQSVLNLTTPSGGAPKDTRFGQITLRHLLESTSGLDNGIIWSDIAAKQAFNSSLPITPLQLARYGATLDLTNNPGDPKQVHYGNTAYFYLSLVLATLYQTQNQEINAFEAALKTSVLDPLKIARIRGSKSIASSQDSDEARYHLGKLPISSSLRQNDQPWVASQYGGWSMENFDGCGGLSAAVTDLAYLAAMLSVRQNNPLLNTTSLDSLMKNAVTATKTLTGPDAHGYHGWDWVVPVDEANHVYHGGKGGWLPGDQSGIIVTTGGLSYIIAINGNTLEGVTTDWYEPVRKIAQAQNWGTTDLFPAFGLASFPAPFTAKSFTIDHIGFIPVIDTMKIQKVSMLNKMPLETKRQVDSD